VTRANSVSHARWCCDALRLGDAELADSVQELDETFLFDRANQIVIHTH
jgi:hypothetical protein